MIVHEIMGESWGNALAPFLPDKYMDELGDLIYRERQVSEIYPSSENVFRAFEMTPLEEVRVVWIAQDPYNDPGQATGLAMSCGKYLSPTMKKVIEVLMADYPDRFLGPVYDGKLDAWAKQGVLLINAALTVRKYAPGSHMKYWQKFTLTVLDVLKASQEAKAFVILGDDAKKLIGVIPPPHYAFVYEHPVAASYNHRTWNAKGLFKGINQFLMDNNRKPIEWS